MQPKKDFATGLTGKFRCASGYYGTALSKGIRAVRTSNMTPDDALHFKIYVAGMTPAAARAIKNLESICSEIDSKLAYRIEVVDILENPQQAEDAKVIATPTVVKHHPPPISRLIGDLSDKKQVLMVLGLLGIG